VQDLQEDPHRGEEWESVEKDIVEELFTTWRFFTPSSGLTRDFLRLNDELGEAYFGGEYEKIAAGDGRGSFEGPVKDINWFKGLYRRVSGILFHGEGEPAGSGEQSEEKVTSFFQSFISERVFNHLAMLSRSRHAKRGGSFSIRDELTKEIAEKLGLGLYLHQKTSPELRAEAEEVLLRLAGEFQRWFIGKKRGEFTTSWGRICAVGNDIALEGESSQPLIMRPDVEIAEVAAR
jgi:hypothetical protein